MTITIPYLAADGSTRAINAEQAGAGIAFHSVPEISGVPVTAAAPMPVTNAAAESSLAMIAAQDTLSATAAGTPADAAYAGSGAASVVALLKGLWNKLGALAVSSAPLSTPVNASIQPTVSVATYGAGQSFGGLIHIANLFPTSKGGTVEQLTIMVNGSDSPPPFFNAIVFNANPTSSILNDHATAVIAQVDYAKILSSKTATNATIGTSSIPSVYSPATAGSYPIYVAGTDIWVLLIIATSTSVSAANDCVITVTGRAY
jgi:hypothetical protein